MWIKQRTLAELNQKQWYRVALKIYFGVFGIMALALIYSASPGYFGKFDLRKVLSSAGLIIYYLQALAVLMEFVRRAFLRIFTGKKFFSYRGIFDPIKGWENDLHNTAVNKSVKDPNSSFFSFIIFFMVLFFSELLWALVLNVFYFPYPWNFNEFLIVSLVSTVPVVFIFLFVRGRLMPLWDQNKKKLIKTAVLMLGLLIISYLVHTNDFIDNYSQNCDQVFLHDERNVHCQMMNNCKFGEFC